MDLSTITKLNEIKPENLCVVTHGGSHFVSAGNSQAFSIKEMVMEVERTIRPGRCQCGCGGLVKPGRKFVNGHNRRTEQFWKKKPERNYCECGCGKRVGWSKKHNRWSHFLRGHNTRLMSEKTKEEIPQSLKEKYANMDHYLLGRQRSKETKRKLSESLSGKNHPQYGKKGKDHPVYGYKHTKDELERMSGKNHPNWKGGISSELYCQEWYIKDYKDSIKERDNYMCQNPECYEKCIILCIHHINYNKKNCKSENLITVCTSCNARANHNRGFWQKHYEGIMKRRGYGKID